MQYYRTIINGEVELGIKTSMRHMHKKAPFQSSGPTTIKMKRRIHQRVEV